VRRQLQVSLTACHLFEHPLISEVLEKIDQSVMVLELLYM